MTTGEYRGGGGRILLAACRNSVSPAVVCAGLDPEAETGSRQAARQSGARSPRHGTRLGYWLLLPVLLFLAGAAAALGASVLRTLPQGSEEALASGIFLRDSL